MKNGLYSIHVHLGDGRTGKGSGVLVLRDGRILGGDSFLHYVGSYEARGETLYGEVVVNQHTPSTSQFPLFGGRQVGIGFSGTDSGGRIVLDGTALVGRESMIFRASLMFLAALEDTDPPAA
ncbi:GrlR family regulatory protein [Enterovirga rhinocerotis]|nr:GrlR family regulatory protein [Enterovirga rhinocerotis]